MTNHKGTSRRDFLIQVGIAATGVAASAALAGCGSEADDACKCGKETAFRLVGAVRAHPPYPVLAEPRRVVSGGC
jgi:hypothetical protein